ncbi:hypothetical protein [Paenibacillus paridis]|uniref:hypothetical protein n=1 Tax=Paenibacillus paridis TaxID=2583376 RepID=UPI001121472F|nr:hypothetical protein [Paenibacillus paridis]
MKIYQTISYSVIMLFSYLILLGGCSNEPKLEEKIAYISKVKNPQDSKTFNDLHFGILNDFNIKLTEADKSWVTLWVEGYINGEKTIPFRLKQFTYGEHRTNKVAEGPLGFGIINSQLEDDTSLFWYSYEMSEPPQIIENILNSEGVGKTTRYFAIGDDEVGLASGETKVLGVYRQLVNPYKVYDYQDINQIGQMINEDKTVLLLLKISVEKKD